ncbi:hypothetical protein RhiirA4_473892 [Rhizophagus irregularis]|uniref:Uncharacterized protein n=1 Tax=Rhizophagus irregularis TaxID=588596 RepID=A0A2I1H7K1_9GLOM|nr:hypothetical protein RhiirA4_473892 [Rhizophagus irregularis]
MYDDKFLPKLSQNLLEILEDNEFYDPTTWTLYEDMNALYSDVEIGYTLKVDLEAPVHLHDFFADYPLTPEKQIVPEEWLSLYNERLVHDKEVGGGKYTTGEKLVQTLYPKKNYVVNYRALQLYMKLVIKVTKIHGGLKFRQSPWMKEYIEENIRKRKIAKATGMSLGLCFKVFERGITAVHMLKSTDKTKGDPIGKSVCLKPKMYSVLPAGHDPKTPDDPDSEDPKRSMASRRQRVLKNAWLRGNFDMITLILLDGIRTLPYGHWRIGLYKRLVASKIAPEEAEERAMKVRLRVKDRNNTKMVVVFLYLERKLRAEKNPNDYIKTVAVKMFPNEEACTLRLENYRKRYMDNDLYASLEELYELYYDLAKEENRERSDDEIEQILRAMAI